MEEREKWGVRRRGVGGKRRKLEIVKTLGGQGIDRPLSLSRHCCAEAGYRPNRWVRND